MNAKSHLDDNTKSQKFLSVRDRQNILSSINGLKSLIKAVEDAQLSTLITNLNILL